MPKNVLKKLFFFIKTYLGEFFTLRMYIQHITFTFLELVHTFESFVTHQDLFQDKLNAHVRRVVCLHFKGTVLRKKLLN